MVNKKVIQLVIKIFTWFDKKRISKIKIKFGSKIELSRILKRFNIRLWIRYSAKRWKVFSIRPSASAKCENAARVTDWC